MSSLQITIINNIGSVVLGVVACVLACLATSRKQVHSLHRYCVGSFTFCGLSLLLQFFEIGNRVNSGDFAAIDDTIRAVIIAVTVLVGITVALNIVALAKGHETEKE